jgi:hypothetical protein
LFRPAGLFGFCHSLHYATVARDSSARIVCGRLPRNDSGAYNGVQFRGTAECHGLGTDQVLAYCSATRMPPGLRRLAD